MLLTLHALSIQNTHVDELTFSSCVVTSLSNNDTSDGGASRVNITGIFANNGLLCFSNSLIHDSNESLDEVPVRTIN